jgi:calcineurin-like phosphoesterase family protein
MNTFFISDTHFHHSNIIKYCNRPFNDAVEMNKTIIKNWNAVVKPDDLVYHLGDFCFGRENYHFDSVFNQLNGKIVFIEGNHDKLARQNKYKFYNYHYGYHEAYVGDQLIVMSHYPMVTWNKKHRGAIMIHGHCHYNLPIGRKESQELGKILDVGVDGNNYKPYSYDELMAVMKTKPDKAKNSLFSDHHGED